MYTLWRDRDSKEGTEDKRRKRWQGMWKLPTGKAGIGYRKL